MRADSGYSARHPKAHCIHRGLMRHLAYIFLSASLLMACQSTPSSESSAEASSPKTAEAPSDTANKVDKADKAASAKTAKTATAGGRANDAAEPRTVWTQAPLHEVLLRIRRGFAALVDAARRPVTTTRIRTPPSRWTRQNLPLVA